MTSYFLLLDVQKEVGVEVDLFVLLNSCPTQVASQKEVEEGARIARVVGRGDVRQVTGFAREGVAYAHRE